MSDLTSEYEYEYEATVVAHGRERTLRYRAPGLIEARRFARAAQAADGDAFVDACIRLAVGCVQGGEDVLEDIPADALVQLCVEMTRPSPGKS